MGSALLGGCIEHLHRLAHNSDNSPLEVVLAVTIFMRAPTAAEKEEARSHYLSGGGEKVKGRGAGLGGR